MQLLGLALPALLLVLLHLSPALAQSNSTMAQSNNTIAGSNSAIAQSSITQPCVIPLFSNDTIMPNATSQLNSACFSIPSPAPPPLLDQLSESALEALPITTLTPGEVSSGPSDTTAQIPISNQDQKSVTSNPVVTVPQPSVKTVPHTTTSMDYQTSSSSDRNPIQTFPSDSTLTDHPSAQNLPTTTPVVVPVPTAVQTVLLEVIISSAAGLADAILAGMGILPPGVSATPGKVANAATESGGNGVEVVQIFPTTTLIVSTVSSVPAATTSAVEGPIVLISAGTGTAPSGKSATLGQPADSAIPSGGNGSGSATGSGSTTGSGSATGSGSTTGSGTPTESVSGQTNVPIVSTGEAEGVNEWKNWWLEFGILVWGVGMVYWM